MSVLVWSYDISGVGELIFHGTAHCALVPLVPCYFSPPSNPLLSWSTECHLTGLPAFTVHASTQLISLKPTCVLAGLEWKPT